MSRPETRLKPAACSDAEWQQRVELAACYRAFVHYGWTDSIFTHLSARVPGEARHYLINPYGLLFHEVCASNLIKVDFDGRVVAGDFPYNEAGHAIHTAVLRAREDVNVVLHSHTRAGMAVSCMSCGLLPLTQQANELRDLLCYHPYGVATDNETECARLGHDIADKRVMIMHNHGLLTVGADVAEAFYWMYETENACKVQVDVLAAGRDYILPEDDVLDDLAGYGNARAGGGDADVARVWDAVMRLLDRQDSTFRD